MLQILLTFLKKDFILLNIYIFKSSKNGMLSKSLLAISTSKIL